MTHILKTEREFFNAVARGSKTFEIRKDDRRPRFKKGDTLKLLQLDRHGRISGKWIAVSVSYITRDKRFVPKGFAVMAVRLFWRNT